MPACEPRVCFSLAAGLGFFRNSQADVMKLTHPNMAKRIRGVCRQRGFVLERMHASLLGSVYLTFRPTETARQVAKMMAATTDTQKIEERTDLMARLVDDLDAGYWCDTLEHDSRA